MISFGPIPSRRLGKSLGINNIPSRKVCSYSCVYCQVGITRRLIIERAPFYEPRVLFTEVQKHLNQLHEKDRPDYLTFVANGEPTIDSNLGESIQLVKTLQIPVAVITNASLLHHRTVRNDLSKADWVSVKVDSCNEQIWKRINRPHAQLNIEQHKEGILQFASEYKGQLATETLLVNGFNDEIQNLHQTAAFIHQLQPTTAYLSIPTRPPAITGIKAPDETTINSAYQEFSNIGLKVELLMGFEGSNTGFTGNAIEDIINICSVHPIREDTMTELLAKDKADYSVVDSLIDENSIKKVIYNKRTFYIRHFRNPIF